MKKRNPSIALKTVLLFIPILLSFFLFSCDKDVTASQNTTPKDTGTLNRHLQAQGIVLGVNRTELPWAAGGSMLLQKKILDSIRSAGCRFVRLSLSRDNLRDKVKMHILYANKIGLKVLVMLKLNGISVIYPSGVKKRSGEGRAYDVYPLSKIDTSLYNQWVKSVLQGWKDAGCKIQVIEVGNEIASADFNGDFKIEPKNEGIIYTDNYNWSDIPDDVKSGIRKVGYLTKVTNEIAYEKFGEDLPKVILGGLNAPYTDWFINQGISLMVPQLALKIIKGTVSGQPKGVENYLENIDGIAVHLYPSQNDVRYKDNYSEMVEDAKAAIGKYMNAVIRVTNLPNYLTEFGYSLNWYGVNQDWKRTKLMEAFLTAVADTKDEYNWRQVYIFSWDQGDKRMVDNGQELYSAKHIFRD